MPSKRLLSMAVATLGLGLGLASSAAPASAGTTMCFTVTVTTPVHSASVGGTVIGTAYAGDGFVNPNGEIGHGMRYGTDQRSDQTGWILLGDEVQGGAGCP